MSWAIEKVRNKNLLFLFFLVAIFPLCSFGWHHSLQKAYPNNQIYKALLFINDHVSNWGVEVDTTRMFRQATAGETFLQMVKDFKELGNSSEYNTQYHYISGKEYVLGLQWKQLSRISIPNSKYVWDDEFWVTVRFISNTEYQVLNATIVNKI